MAVDDSLQARITTECPPEIRDVLLHSWSHDLGGLKKLLNERETASLQDPKTGETPLHAAIRACGPAEAKEDAAAESKEDEKEEEEEEDGCVEEAREILQELFFSGAIWNDVDDNNETPGCVADRLGRKALYNMCVDAGVRAELLFSLMDAYEELSSGDEDEDETMGDAAAAEGDEEKEAQDGEVAPESNGEDKDKGKGVDGPRFTLPDADTTAVTSDEYLASKLTYDDRKLLDADLNGVMMSWETDIMRRSVAALLPDAQPGGDKRILNIGFGMGIVDGLFADLQPARHHIVEAHPSVLEHLAAITPGSRFGPDWEASGPQPGAYKVHAGKWQDVVPALLEAGEVYDAIYFDTFGEDYAQLRTFFMDYVPGLMDQEGRFSFFNGLGADRRICYDVYTKVVEMHCADAGLDIEWEVSKVDMKDLAEDGKGEWEGVRRRYWTLDTYRLPICTFMG